MSTPPSPRAITNLTPHSEEITSNISLSQSGTKKVSANMSMFIPPLLLPIDGHTTPITNTVAATTKNDPVRLLPFLQHGATTTITSQQRPLVMPTLDISLDEIPVERKKPMDVPDIFGYTQIPQHDTAVASSSNTSIPDSSLCHPSHGVIPVCATPNRAVFRSSSSNTSLMSSVGQYTSMAMFSRPIHAVTASPDEKQTNDDDSTNTYPVLPPNDGPYKDEMTYVSMFIDLQGRRKDARRNATQYLQYAKEFILRLDVPMVLFIEPSYIDEVRQVRESHGLSDKTHIVPITLEELPYYKQFVQLGEKHFYMPIAGMTMPKYSFDYRIIVCSKFTVLERAYEMNPFGTEHFAWIDFGCNCLLRPVLSEIYEPAKHSIIMEELIYVTPGETQDLRTYYSHIRTPIHGAFIRARGDYVKLLCQWFDEELHRAWDMHFLPPAEEILGVVYDRHRDQFDPLYMGSYESPFCNRHAIHNGLPYLLTSLPKMRLARDYKRGYEIVCKLCESQQAGRISMNDQEMFQFLDEAFIMSYYVGDEDMNNHMARELLLHMCTHAPKFNAHLSRIRKNMNYFCQ